VRGDFDWSNVEPSDGDWRFARHDRLVADLKQRGMEMQGTLCYTAQWASTGDRNSKDWLDWARAMPEMEPWLDYVKTTVKRYKGSVRYWEIWNEPDISFWKGTPGEYARLFNETSGTIREADPKAEILNGGLAMVRREPNPNFREAFLEQADTKNWDIRAYHDYHTFREMTERHPEHKALYQRSTLAELPVWINEGGSHTLVPDGERQQTIHLVKKLAAAPSFSEVSAYIWYQLNDLKPEGNDPEHRFGLCDYFFRPKPAYGAYQQLIRELAPRKYLARKDGGPAAQAGVGMQVYQGQGDHRLVIWQEGAKSSVPVLLTWSGKKTEVTAASDLMGNPLPVSRLQGRALVTIGNEPVYGRTWFR